MRYSQTINVPKKYKFLSIILLLGLVISMIYAITIYKKIEKNKELDNIVKNLNNKVNILFNERELLNSMLYNKYVYYDLYSNKLLEQLIFENNASIDISNKSDEDINYLDQLCTLKIGDAHRNFKDIHLAYACLAKINNHRYKVGDNIYKAIINISHALELCYSLEHVRVLNKSLILGYEKIIPDKFKNLEKYITGLEKDEIPILNELIALNIPQITARVNYRLSLIHTLGRASSKEDTFKYNLPLAIKELNKSIKLAKIQANNIIDVVFTINNRYTNYLSTAIASILLNSDFSTFYKFYVIEERNNPLTEDSKEKLRSLNYIRNYNIEFIKVPVEIENNQDVQEILSMNKNSKWSEIASYRLFLDKILPKLNKVIYLDADILVFKDLAHLTRINLKDYFIAGVSVVNVLQREGSHPEHPWSPWYINSGVLVMNLDKMRKEDITNKFLNTYRKNKGYLLAPDQDLINQTLKDNIYLLSYQWNSRILRDPPPGGLTFIRHYLTKPINNEVIELIKTNQRDKLSKFDQEFFRYYNLTPWAEQYNY